MPTRLKAELKAVQTSIAHVKRQIQETTDKKQIKKMENVLSFYYDEEEHLLCEIERLGGF